MKKCSCGTKMDLKKSKTPEGIEYNYFKCKNCGEEIVDMKQLHAVAQKYRLLKQYNARMTQWGKSLGVRIPKELVVKYHFKPNEDVSIIPTKDGIEIVPIKE